MTASIHKRAAILLATTAFLGLTACDDVAVFNAQHKLAFTTTAAMGAPDGLTTEAGWNDGFTFKMEDGAPQAAATMLGVATASDLHLAFTAKDRTCDEDTVAGCTLEDYPLFNHDDIIVVAFNVDGTNTGYRRLHIQPCFNDAAGSPNNKCSTNAADSRAAKITYWNGTWDGTNMDWGMPLPLPANLAAHTTTQIVALNPTDKPSEGTWQTEVRIPRVSFPFPATGNFGFFVDVISADSSQDGAATQYSWPTTQQIGAADGAQPTASVEATLAPTKWGVATLDGTGFTAGVQLVGFGSNQTDQSLIDLGDNDPLTDDRNEFHATITNAAASAGSPPAATNVVATFKIANWGISTAGAWDPVPVDDTSTGSNPTAGVTLNPREYRTVYSGGWTLTAAQRTAYSPPNHHQCVKVELTGSGAVINQPSYQFNMDFAVVNSPFEKVAQINMRGAKEFEGARRVILQEEFTNVPAGIGWKSRFSNAEQLAVNQWSMKLGGEASNKLGLWILADERLRLPLQNYQFSPDNALEGSRIPVKSGQVISLIVDGGIGNGKQFFSPMGLTGEKPRQEMMSGPGQVMRSAQLDKAPFPVGALVGSFDGFQTSFMIGSAASMLVPEGAQELSIMLAGKPAEALRGAKGGFNIGVITTGIEPHMVKNYPLLRKKRGKFDYLMPFGVNLPTYIVRGTVETGAKIRIGNRVYNSRMPLGSFGSYIRAVNQGGGRFTPVRPDLDIGNIREIQPGRIRDAATIRRDVPN